MPRAFDITLATALIRLNASGRGEVSFTISNALRRAVRARASAEPRPNVRREWLLINGPPEWDLPADGTRQLTVHIAVPPGTTPVSYAFNLVVTNVANPDEEYAISPDVAFEVVPAAVPTRRRFPWWVIAAAAGVILVAGVTFALARRGGGGQAVSLDPVDMTYLDPIGGPGGGSFAFFCPPGHVGTGIQARFGHLVQQIQLVCRELLTDGMLGNERVTEQAWFDPSIMPDAVTSTMHCLEGEVLAGQDVGLLEGSYVSQVVGRCVPVTSVLAGTLDGQYSLGPLGTASETLMQSCPGGMVVTGMHGRSGWYLDQLGLVCTRMSRTRIQGDLAPVVGEGTEGDPRARRRPGGIGR